jgi:hypothetical protein
MSTQGLLSITKRGQVVAKIVAGCNGYNIPSLAAAIRANPTTKAKELADLCNEHEVGCYRCLVIQLDRIEYFVPEDMEFDGGKLWRENFSNPKFNPRWENGTAAYTEVVEL